MGLSPKLVEVIGETLQRLRADGLSLLLVEQNAMLTFGATSHCLVLENGEIALAGTPPSCAATRASDALPGAVDATRAPGSPSRAGANCRCSRRLLAEILARLRALPATS